MFRVRVLSSQIFRPSKLIFRGKPYIFLSWKWDLIFAVSLFSTYYMYKYYAIEPIGCDISTLDPPSLFVKTTSSVIPFFPKVINSNLLHEPYCILGVGSRYVTFMKFKVYVAGLYIPSSELSKLVDILKSSIFKAPFNNSAEILMQMYDSQKCMSVVSSLLESNIKFVIRIVPIRNTRFSHLRDGFMSRLLNQMDEHSKVSLSNDLTCFKSIWPAQQKFYKGDELLLCIMNTNTIRIIYNNHEIGTFVGNEAIVKSVLYNYLCGKHVISKEVQKDTIEGFINLVMNS